MKDEFLKKEIIKPREIYSWEQVNCSEDFFKVLLNSFSEDYKGKYGLEGKIEEIKSSLEENERKFINFLLRVLEVIDFWERIIETETSPDQKIEKFRSGYQFLLEELAKIKVKPDGPEIGSNPRKGKDIVEGTEERVDLPDGTICNIIKKCYLFEDRVLRKAKVIIVKTGG